MSDHLPGRGRRTALAVSATLALLLSVAGTAAGALFVWAEGRLAHEDYVSRTDPDTGEITIDGECAREGCNFLVLGSDSRSGLSPQDQEHTGTPEQVEGEHSDTIILVHVPEGAGAATILHFPRDLWVQIPGQGWGKINGAFEGGARRGGADLMARTIERLTGLEVDHFLFVDLAGFQGIVDAIGGVPICVDRPMLDAYTGLDLPEAGCYDMDGATALAFVRSRHQACDEIPDFARISRQQQFLRAVLSKMLAPSQLANIPSLVPAVGRNIVKDERLGALGLASLASDLQGVSTGDTDFRVVPGSPELIHPPGYPEGLSIVRLAPEARELFLRLRTGRPLGRLGIKQEQTPPSPAVIATAVVDHRSGGSAGEVFDLLARGGFLVESGPVTAAEAGIVEPRAGIYHAPGAEDAARVVGGYLPSLPILGAPGQLPPRTDVVVVIGPRYEPEPEPADPSTSCPGA
jgi:LCP family protein required for cell wall assembly